MSIATNAPPPVERHANPNLELMVENIGVMNAAMNDAIMSTMNANAIFSIVFMMCMYWFVREINKAPVFQGALCYCVM